MKRGSCNPNQYSKALQQSYDSNWVLLRRVLPKSFLEPHPKEVYWGISGLYRDHGKENGNHDLGLYRGFRVCG